jgi:hypothetical protein
VTATTRSRSSARPAARKAGDAVCLSDEAVELARGAAIDLEGTDAVGEHLGSDADDERLATHYFACTMKSYRGWRWAVTVARASRAKTATVSEVVLLPGAEAVLAPAWVPWSERLRPGDLGPGDILPTEEDDPRLVPGFVATDEDVPLETIAEQLGPIGWELGLGRVRVLSRHGRDDAADRWYAGDAGPESPVARVAPAACGTCGFFVSLAGSLSQAFGACTNEFSPSDGRVVSLDHGCGAHSEAAVASHVSDLPEPVLDEVGYDLLVIGAEHSEGSVTPETPAEDLGHS